MCEIKERSYSFKSSGRHRLGAVTDLSGTHTIGNTLQSYCLVDNERRSETTGVLKPVVPKKNIVYEVDSSL